MPFPVEYHGVTSEKSLKALADLFKADVDPTQVAAIIIEPMQGEGGFYIAPFEFLKKLRAICDEHGILLIADEIQSGFGRTGRFFGIEHSGVVPDLITVAKSLAGGFPLSGVVGRADVMDAPAPGGLGGTYGGNPIACAAALAVLEVIEEENLLQRSLQIGERVHSHLETIARRNNVPPIGDIRSLGGMIAFELVKDLESREPDPETTKALTARALEEGLVLLSCGVYGNTIRILVPLTATDALIDEGLDIIEKSLVAVRTMTAAT